MPATEFIINYFVPYLSRDHPFKASGHVGANFITIVKNLMASIPTFSKLTITISIC